jgi:hypothetical protein
MVLKLDVGLDLLTHKVKVSGELLATMGNSTIIKTNGISSINSTRLNSRIQALFLHTRLEHNSRRRRHNHQCTNTSRVQALNFSLGIKINSSTSSNQALLHGHLHRADSSISLVPVKAKGEDALLIKMLTR